MGDDMEENNSMKKLSLEELKEIGGGVIVEVNGSYWAVKDERSDNGEITIYTIGFRDKNNAISVAESEGWSITEMTVEEFEKEYGITDFNPDKWRPIV